MSNYYVLVVKGRHQIRRMCDTVQDHCFKSAQITGRLGFVKIVDPANGETAHFYFSPEYTEVALGLGGVPVERIPEEAEFLFGQP